MHTFKRLRSWLTPTHAPHTHTHTRARARAHAHTHAHTLTHTHTHTYIHRNIHVYISSLLFDLWKLCCGFVLHFIYINKLLTAFGVRSCHLKFTNVQAWLKASVGENDKHNHYCHPLFSSSRPFYRMKTYS